ncbi:MAG TPA: BON domain-containing protein [Candidatus Kapabacteria bacterium]|nr:BON domain-containing protein [Candidatus Kapabacteria bacterium]
MSEYDRTDRSHGDHERNREAGFERWASNTPRRQSDHLHSDYRSRANMSSNDRIDYDQRDRNRADRYAGQYGRNASHDRDHSSYASNRSDDYRDSSDRNIWTRSVDEVRSWFGDDEAERRRLRDEEERMRQDQIGAYHNHSYVNDRDDHRNDDSDRSDSARRAQRSNQERGWDSSRGYGSNIDRDYGRNNERNSRTDTGRSDASYFRSSNDYGGPRNRDYFRDYPTHNSGRSSQNNEDDEMKHGYESQFDYHQSNTSNSDRMFGGRDYERNYPTRAERDPDTHDHDLSGGWQSTQNQRGYRSLNNTGRTGIGQDNHLGKDRSTRPNPQDQNYSHGDYTPNLNAGGQEYDSRHYEQRGRLGSAINEQAQRGYSQGYGRTGYSLDQPGNYANAEVGSTKHPKNYKGTDDRIYVEVCESLGRELDASDIEVTSSGSEITLTGSVRSRDDKRRAERIAERVIGVEDVHNRLTVKQDTYSSSKADTNSGSSSDSSDRAATQYGNSSRTEPSADGASQTQGRTSEGSSADGTSRSSSANGSGKSSGRK